MTGAIALMTNEIPGEEITNGLDDVQVHGDFLFAIFVAKGR
jgi:hypothetical protein